MSLIYPYAIICKKHKAANHFLLYTTRVIKTACMCLCMMHMLFNTLYKRVIVMTTSFINDAVTFITRISSFASEFIDNSRQVSYSWVILWHLWLSTIKALNNGGDTYLSSMIIHHCPHVVKIYAYILRATRTNIGIIITL